MVSQPKHDSSILIALLPAAVVLAAYATWTQLWPSERALQIAKLEEELQQAESEQVPEEQRLEIAEQVRQLSDSLEIKRAQLRRSRNEATGVLRARMSATREVQAARRVNEVLRDAGLTMVAQTPTNAANTRLLESLEFATETLGETLRRIEQAAAETAEIKLPADLPRDMNPQEWIALQRRRMVSKFRAPTTKLNDVRLVGGYQDMVRALEGIIDSCPEVVVASVSFEKSKSPASSTNTLIWDLRLQLRPMRLSGESLAQTDYSPPADN